MLPRQARQTGFTLVEIAIVIVLMGVVSSLAFISFWGTYQRTSADTSAELTLTNLKKLQSLALANNQSNLSPGISSLGYYFEIVSSGDSTYNVGRLLSNGVWQMLYSYKLDNDLVLQISSGPSLTLTFRSLDGSLGAAFQPVSGLGGNLPGNPVSAIDIFVHPNASHSPCMKITVMPSGLSSASEVSSC